MVALRSDSQGNPTQQLPHQKEPTAVSYYDTDHPKDAKRGPWWKLSTPTIITAAITITAVAIIAIITIGAHS